MHEYTILREIQTPVTPEQLGPLGDELEMPEESLLDWMVNDNGVLHGGFSIRYYRSTLPEDERDEYDNYIGVTEYA
jgi:uncharacterized protein YegJ (DUF2314 family)